MREMWILWGHTDVGWWPGLVGQEVERQLQVVIKTLCILVCFPDHFAIEDLAQLCITAIYPMPF